MNQFIKIDFPLNLCGVDVDKTPKTYYLTISAILNLNNASSEVVKIQGKILKDISSQNLIGSGIYKYPIDTIHFSIINFEGLSSSIDAEKIFKQKRQSHIEKIKKVLHEFDQEQIVDKKIKFAYIYRKKPNSIAIQTFPSKKLYSFFKKVRKKFNEDADLRPAEIKKFEYDGSIRFPVNIIRFFRELTKEEYDNIAQRVLTKNQQSKKGYLFESELSHISFVLSDNWLSNQNPELDYIELR